MLSKWLAAFFVAFAVRLVVHANHRAGPLTEEEAYSAFVFGLKPHLVGQVGAHTHGDLSAAQAIAESLDHYTTSTKGDAGPNGGSGTTGGWSSGRGARGGVAQKKGQLNAMEKKPADTGGQSGGDKKG